MFFFEKRRRSKKKEILITLRDDAENERFLLSIKSCLKILIQTNLTMGITGSKENQEKKPVVLIVGGGYG